MNKDMSGDSWLVVELGLALLVITVFSFFFSPTYAKSVDRITDVLAIAFTSVISYKFGRTMPQQASDPKVGQASTSDVHQSSTQLPPEVVPGK
jgi:protein-S-isoprenylcysteine O-methyltransferase Ste14